MNPTSTTCGHSCCSHWPFNHISASAYWLCIKIHHSFGFTSKPNWGKPQMKFELAFTINSVPRAPEWTKWVVFCRPPAFAHVHDCTQSRCYSCRTCILTARILHLPQWLMSSAESLGINSNASILILKRQNLRSVFVHRLLRMNSCKQIQWIISEMELCCLSERLPSIILTLWGNFAEIMWYFQAVYMCFLGHAWIILL